MEVSQTYAYQLFTNVHGLPGFSRNGHACTSSSTRPLSLPHNLGMRLNPGHPNLIPRMQRLGSTHAQAVNARPLSLPHDLGMGLNSGCPCLIPKIRDLGWEKKSLGACLLNCFLLSSLPCFRRSAIPMLRLDSSSLPSLIPTLGLERGWDSTY